MPEKKKDLKAEHKRVYDLFSRFRQAKQALETKWVVNILTTFTYEKWMFTEKVQNIERLDKFINSDTARLHMKTQKILPIFRALFSKIIKTNPIIRAAPEGLDAQNDFGAELSESILKEQYTKWKRFGLNSRNAFWLLMTGNAFSKNVFNPKKGALLPTASGAEALRKGEIETEAISSFEVYQPMNVLSIEHAPIAMQTVLMLRKDATAQFPMIKKGEGSVDTNIWRNKLLLSGSPFEITYTSTSSEDYIEMIIVYERPTEEYPKGNMYIMTDKQIVKDYEELNTPDNEIPICQGKFIETGFAFGETPISFLVPIDREISLYRGQLAVHAEKLANPIPCLPYKSKISSEEFGNRHAKVFRYDERTGKPFWLQPAEMSQYFFNNLNRLEMDMQDIASIHDPSMGKRPEGVRSGLHQAYMSEEDDQQHSPTIDNFFNMYVSLGIKLLKLSKKHYKETRAIKIFGKENIYYAEFSGKDLQENPNVDIYVAGGMPSNRVAKQSMVMQLTAGGMITTNEGREILEFGELDPIFRKDYKDKVRQRIEIQKIKNNKTGEVKVTRLENHIVHIRVVIDWTKSSEFETMMSDEQKEFTFKHLEEHVKALVELFTTAPVLAATCMDATHIDQRFVQFLSSEIELYQKRQAYMEQKRAAKLAAAKQAAQAENRELSPEEEGTIGAEAGNQAADEFEQEQRNKAQSVSGVPPQIAMLQKMMNQTMQGQGAGQVPEEGGQ